MQSNQSKGEAESLLENWGRYVRDDWWTHLDYAAPPATRIYNALKRAKDGLPPKPPVNVTEAEIANEAILNIGVREAPQDGRAVAPFDLYRLIVARWAKRRSPPALAQQFRCSRQAVHYRLARAQEDFWDEYQRIVRQRGAA